jgi:4-amino-4-deoxy-L-arabinose transferase-like glycosyltransferase
MSAITRPLATHSTGAAITLSRWFACAIRYPFFLLACAYFVLNVARLPDLVHYFTDEQYYTNSAIRMAQGGSWLVPVYPDGEPRLEKPLLTYWVLALSFKALGITVLASRLPFLLAGAALVCATAHLALVLFGSRKAAILAPIVLVSSSYFDRLSLRSTPDILLCLFVTISWIGLARILLRDDTSWQARAAFWCGTAAAIATKGGLGLLFLAFAACVLILHHGPARTRRNLIHVPSMSVALGLVFVACAQPILLAESDGIGTIYRDQIGARLASSWLDVPARLWEYAVSTVKYFPLGFGLLVTAALADRSSLAGAWRTHRASLLLVLAWFALLLVVFSAANWYRGRYLAPAYPPLACALAVLITRTAANERTSRIFARLSRAVLMVLAVATLLFGAALLRIEAGAGAALLAAGLAILIGWCAVHRSSGLKPVFALGAALFLVTAVIGGFVTPALERVPVEAIAARLMQLQQPAAIVHSNGTMTSQLRLVSGGKLDVSIIPAGASVEECASIPVWIVPESSRARFASSGRRFEPCAVERWKPRPLELLRLVVSSDPRAKLEQRAETFYLACADEDRVR